MNTDAAIWDRFAPGYAKQPIADESVYEKKLEITRRYLRPHMRVYEFGCGTGSTALAHAPFVSSINATDFSASMIQIARDKAAAAQTPNVTFRVETLDTATVPEGGYDAVLGLNVLHLMRDPEAACRQVHEMLKPGGYFFSSTACVSEIMPLFGLIAPAGRLLRLLPYVSIFGKQRLLDMQKAAGFDLVEEYHPSRKTGVFLVAQKRAA